MWEAIAIASVACANTAAYEAQREQFEVYRRIGQDSADRFRQLQPSRRIGSNCRNCGAPHEIEKCSYCLTPNQ